MVCTFFGHRDTPERATPLLHDSIVDLIENKGVTDFYVGYNGNFDNRQKRMPEIFNAEDFS